MQIGPYKLEHPLILAPMAGVTDRPFRQLARRFGAALAVSEMVTSDTRLWNSRKSRLRLDHHGEAGPISVQIAGADPNMLAQAACENVLRGAQIIDINMGCPAKKVCKVAAGSALLENERLVERILGTVTAAVDVPVTLKIRTGPDPEGRNAPKIAEIAEQNGIAALAVHGRTRACKFQGAAEYHTIAQVKRAVHIPVIANGDITTPEIAKQVLDATGADAIMIGRAAQGQPWLFERITQYLASGEAGLGPSADERSDILLGHLESLYQFYGDVMGVRIARKHLGWYLRTFAQGQEARREINKIETATAQTDAVRKFLQQPRRTLTEAA